MTQNATIVLELPIELNANTLLKKLSLENKVKKISKKMKNAAEKAVKEIKNKTKGKIVYRVIPLQKKEKKLLLDNHVVIKSNKLSSVFDKCSKALVFVSTIGSDIEKEITIDKRNSYYSYIFDKAASLAVEQTAEYIHNYTKKNINPEEGTTNRYSPGYCDWSIEEQKNFLQVIPYNEIGIKLSDKSFMFPRKSISGIIGIGNFSHTRKYGNACNACKNTKCAYRREDN